jgi:hypothetical protein
MTGAAHHHRRRRGAHWAEHDTPLCSAFLIAVARWCMAHRDDPAARVMLPTGCVTVAELVRVLGGLEAARNGCGRHA